MDLNKQISGKRSITLIITERCDLACTYCYEHNKSAQQMTFEQAKSIIDKELVDLDKYTYSIEFFGGEPFLNFSLIKKVVEYVLNTYKGNYYFFATTNGTQIHGEIQEWLKNNKDIFTLGLSLDGNRIAHNLNRSNSFDKIDLSFFRETYPLQPIKMTISEKSLPYLADSIKFLTEYGFLITCNLAYMIDWFSESNMKTLERELNKLIEYYIENPNIPKCNMMDFHIEILSHPDQSENKIRKYCGCGTNMHCYDITGASYPCQLFSPLSAGDKSIQIKDFKISDELDKSNFLDECNNCYYQRLCQFCLGSNYLSTGNMYQIDTSRCKLYKLIFKANAKLKALEWKNGIKSTDDEQGLLRSILHISTMK